MGEASKIEWCDHTFNPWQGCTKVSAACDFCYAERWAQRSGLVEWGDHPRRRSSAGYWQQPLRWDRQSEAAQVRARVFCCSLADVFDNQAPQVWRDDLFHLIGQTPWLHWLLLTKRIGNATAMMPTHWDAIDGLPGVAIGATVCNPDEAARDLPKLRLTPARTRFVSYEPALGLVDFSASLTGPRRIDWVIAGGESGPHARPAPVDWFRGVRDQCRAAGVPFFFKQWGEWIDADHWLDIIKGGPSQIYIDGIRWTPARPLNFTDAARLAQVTGDRRIVHHSDGTTSVRVGKQTAGALLDGVAHREFPAYA